VQVLIVGRVADLFLDLALEAVDLPVELVLVHAGTSTGLLSSQMT
jgi:hypothetical protein